MIRILPKYGISFIKIDRITTEGPDGKPEVISASRVRKLLDEQGVTDEVLSLVPECTAKYLKESFKQLRILMQILFSDFFRCMIAEMLCKIQKIFAQHFLHLGSSN